MDFVYNGVDVCYLPHPKLAGNYEFIFNDISYRLSNKKECIGKIKYLLTP